MGKSWKSRSHLNTGYPYNPIRAAHLQVIRPRVHNEDEEKLYLGIYADGHPIFSKAELNARRPDLKRLEFMRTYSQYYVTKVASLYKNSRACLPSTCVAGLSSIESRVTNLSGPLVAGLQDNSERMLWGLDCRVDAVFKAAVQAIHPLTDAEAKALALAKSASDRRQAFVQSLEETVQFLRENGVAGSARQAFSMLVRRLEETRMASQGQEVLPLTGGVGDAWSKLAANPAVHRLLEQAQPSLEFTQRKYTDAHDVIVASAMYHRAVGTAADVLQRVTETSVFKAAVERLYPAISGLADPALERIAASSYTQAVIEHLKPVPREELPCSVDCVSC